MIELILGDAGLMVGIIGAGLAVGIILGRITKKKPAAQQAGPVRAICDCGHPRSMHDKKGCGSKVKQRIGLVDGYNWVTCPCLQYDGPTPIQAEFFRPFPVE